MDAHSAPVFEGTPAQTEAFYQDGSIVETEPTVKISVAQNNEGNYTPADAARALAQFRWGKQQADAAPVEAKATEPPPEAQNSGDEPDAAPEETQTSAPEEPTQAEPAEELPPIEPPRSWTKEEREEFATYPREAQEKIARREQERDAALRRGQNEAAELRKVMQTEAQKAEQARKDYESKLPALLQALESAQAAEFSDIKTVDDAQRLSREDPFRFIQWQAHQDKIRAVAYEAEQVKQREASERSKVWTEHVQSENAKVADLHPELADPAKAEALQKAAVQLLSDKGFTSDELNRFASGEDKLSIWDHRIQSLILDGVKYREAQKAPIRAVPKPVPPVVRPAAAAPKQATDAAEIQALEKQLERASGLEALRIGARLTNLKRAG